MFERIKRLFGIGKTDVRKLESVGAYVTMYQNGGSGYSYDSTSAKVFYSEYHDGIVVIPDEHIDYYDEPQVTDNEFSISDPKESPKWVDGVRELCDSRSASQQCIGFLFGNRELRGKEIEKKSGRT